MEEGARQSILRGVLALLLLLPGIAVAAVERTVLTQEDLSRRVSSNFYVVGVRTRFRHMAYGLC